MGLTLPELGRDGRPVLLQLVLERAEDKLRPRLRDVDGNFGVVHVELVADVLGELVDPDEVTEVLVGRRGLGARAQHSERVLHEG